MVAFPSVGPFFSSQPPFASGHNRNNSLFFHFVLHIPAQCHRISSILRKGLLLPCWNVTFVVLVVRRRLIMTMLVFVFPATAG
jgi:hypothetical protein